MPVEPDDQFIRVPDAQAELIATNPLPHERRVQPFVTAAMIAGSVAATGLAWLAPEKLPAFLYSSGYDIWHDHKLLGLFGSIFLHGGALHLFFNCYWLWFLGGVLERVFGVRQYVLFVLACAWATGSAELAVSGNPGVGLSGILYGIFGYMLANRKRDDLFRFVLPKNTVVMLLVWLVACIPLTLTGAMKIANGAHFGGFIFGLAVGWFGWSSRVKFYASCLAAALVLSVPIVWAPWQSDWQQAQAIRQVGAKRYDEALATLDVLLQRNPSDAWALASRGRILLLQKNYKAAKETLLRVTPAVPDAQLANALAWMLATCPDDSVRDGVAAIKWASKACKLTNWTEAGIIDTYAAACAEIGDFESAVKWAEESIQRAKGDKKVFQEHLAAFQQRKPWRE